MTKDDESTPKGKAPENAHTELRPSKDDGTKTGGAAGPQPRSKVMPKDLDDDDDMFNDMPV